mgnify:CR=1 FL=1
MISLIDTHAHLDGMDDVTQGLLRQDADPGRARRGPGAQDLEQCRLVPLQPGRRPAPLHR